METIKRIDDRTVLVYGYIFYGSVKGPFYKAIGNKSIDVYAYLSKWLSGAAEPTVEVIVKNTEVGKARTAHEARPIGKRGLRSIVFPALAAMGIDP